jgi:hypothetical protein
MRTRVTSPLLALLLLVVAALPAGGQSSGGSYSAAAASSGLELRLGGQDAIVVGRTDARLASGPAPGCPDGALACASGLGLVGAGESATAQRPGNLGPNTVAPQGTVGTPLAQALDLAIGAATAQVTEPPRPRSLAGAQAASIDVTLTQSLFQQAPPLQEAVDGALEGIGTVLDPIGEQDPSGVVNRIDATLEDLLGDLASAPIVSIEVGPTISEALHSETGTAATSTSAGLRLVLAPTPQNLPLAPEGLVILDVGSASATASTDERTGAASFSPAIARVRIFDPTTGTYSPDEVIASGEGRQCLSDTGAPPELTDNLNLCVTAGGGNTTQQGPAAASRASGVSIEAFAGGMELLTLNLADATAGVNAAPPVAQAAPSPQPSPSPSPTGAPLPRTGPAVAATPLAAALLACGALVGVGLLRRRR